MSGDSHEVLGPYVIHERLGAGGMATVHRAEHVGVAGFRRPIALKRLFPHVADEPDMLKMFIHEARLASHLRHANVAATYDLGKVDDTYFIAMEYVPGPTLTQVMKQCSGPAGPMPVPIVLSILMQLCDALDHAHNLTDDSGRALGIIHRDVSPSNIIVSSSGVVKLIDFGIAKAAFGDVKTQTGMIKGKYAYIAPEYTFGHLDLRADLFGVGIVAHEMLATRRLFNAASDFETIKKLREQEITPPSQWNPNVPPDLDDIVLTALKRDPTERWQSAGAMRIALTNVAKTMQGAVTTSQSISDWIEWAFDRQARPVFTTGLARTLDTLDELSASDSMDVPTHHRLEIEALGAVADAADPTIPPPARTGPRRAQRVDPPDPKTNDPGPTPSPKWPVEPPRSSPNVVRRATTRPSQPPEPEPPPKSSRQLPATKSEDFSIDTDADARSARTPPPVLDTLDGETVDLNPFGTSASEPTNADWRPKRPSQPAPPSRPSQLPGMTPFPANRATPPPVAMPLGGPGSPIGPAKHLAPHQATLVAERAALLPNISARPPAVPSLANATVRPFAMKPAEKPVLNPSEMPVANQATLVVVPAPSAAERVTLLEAPPPSPPPLEPAPERASIPAHVFPAGEESGELLVQADPAALKKAEKAAKKRDKSQAAEEAAPVEAKRERKPVLPVMSEKRRAWPWLLLVVLVLAASAAWYFYFIAGVDLNI